MFKVPINELKDKIRQGVNISEIELDARIKEKINELSGLVSEEGAAHILANELGVKIVAEEGRLKIKDIYAGMRNIEVLGKVVSKTQLREFDTGTRKGKVSNIVVGDETGTVRLVCWGEQAELVNQVKETDVVLVKSGYAKENNFNQKEIHLNDKSKFTINPEGETIGDVRQVLTQERKKVNELKEGNNGVEILGTIVQMFDPRYFQVCPQCNKKVTEKEDGFYCNAHDKVEPTHSYVVNAVIDDGTGTIRAVFWKNQTNDFLSKTEEDMIKFKENLGLFEETKTDLLGEQFKLVGRVSRNDMFDRLEFNTQLVNRADAEQEIKRLEG